DGIRAFHVTGVQTCALPICEVHLLLFRDAAFIRVTVDDAGERATKARQMGAAIALGNVVCEAENILVVAVVPPHCHFDPDIVLQIGRASCRGECRARWYAET